MQILARGAVQHVQIPVAVGLCQRLDHLAAALHRDQKQIGVAVIVPDVVRRELEMPLELSRLRGQRQHRVGIEIVPLTRLAIPVRGGIACGPEEHVLLGVVRACDPSRSPPVLPRVTRPGFYPFLPLTWDRIATPLALACLHVIGIDITADAILAAGNAYDHLVLDHQGGYGGAIAVGVLVHFGVPHYRPCLTVQRYQPRVQSRHEHLVVGNGHSAVGRPTADAQVVGERVVVPPQGFTGGRVQGKQVIVRRRQVENAIGDDGRGFQLAGNAGLEDPGHLQFLDVLAVEVFQGAEAPALIVAAVHQPG